MPVGRLRPIVMVMTRDQRGTEMSARKQSTNHSRTRRLATRLAGIIAGGAMIGTGLCVGTAAVAGATTTGSVTFFPSGAALQYWTVPPGVDTAQFAVRGAEGGWFLGTTNPEPGGRAGAVIGSMRVLPGSTYSL